MDNENNNLQGGSPWVMVAIFAAIIFLTTMIFPSNPPAKNTVSDSTQEMVMDTIFERESEDSLKYKMDIISCESTTDFTIRKIVNNSGHGTYEIIAKMLSGDYKILNIDENNIDFFVLGSKEAKPYAIVKFTNSSSSTVSTADIYLPYEYTIETASKTDSVSSNCDIVREESE